MNNEFEELVGKVEIDDEYECARCHELYMLRDGDQPTKYCDHCAHEIIEENDL